MLKKFTRKKINKVKTYTKKNKESFRFLIEKDYNNHHINYLVAKLLIQLKYNFQAEKFIEKAISNKSKAKYYYTLGSIMKKQGKWRFSCEAFEKAEQLGFMDRKKKFYKYYAESLGYMKWYDQSSAMWDRYFEKIKVATQKELTNAAIQNMEANNLERAKILFERALELQTDNKDLGIGILLEKYGYWKEANAAYLQLLNEIKNPSGLLYYKLGVSYDKQYNFEKAEEYIKKAVEIEKLDYMYSRLGYVYDKLEKWDKSYEAHIQSAELSERFNNMWYFSAAFSLYKMGKFKESCELFELKRQKEKEFNIMKNKKEKKINNDFYILAQEKEANEDWESAKIYYQKAIYSTNNLVPELYERLGYCLYKCKRYEEAVEKYIEQRTIWYNYKIAYKKISLNQKYIEYYNNLRIQEDIILYESYGGDKIAGNPLAIFKHLYDTKKLIHFIVLKDLKNIPENLLNKENIYFVKQHSDLYLRLLAQAKYLVNNTTFQRYIYKEGQKYLNTWHGTPIKSMGKYIEEKKYISAKNIVRNFYNATHLISPNLYTHEVMMDSYWIGDAVKNKKAITGYPRQDLMLNMSEVEKIHLKETLNINNERKILLYAPTWRGVGNKSNLDNDMTLQTLNELARFNNLNILYLGHYLDNFKMKHSNVIQVQNLDTNELLSIVDILVTDYSSISIDFLAMEKPIIYFTYDIEKYRSERGLIFEIDDITEHNVQTIEDLSSKINQLIENPSIDIKQKHAKEKFCNLDDGKATERVVNFFFDDDLEYRVKEKSNEKQNLLIFPGHFLVNGITTSAINLIKAIDKEKYNITVFISINMYNKSSEIYLFNYLDNLGVSYVIDYDSKMMTISEGWIQKRFYTTHNIENNRFNIILDEINSRNYKRLFGQAKYDCAIDFSSYNREFTLTISNSNSNKKLVFLHNDMWSEHITKYPYLKTIFSNYNKFDKIISVSKQTSELNQVNLANRFNILQSKFDYFDNLQDNKKIIRLSEEGFEIEDDKQYFKDSMVFFSIGRLSPEKDHEKMILAFDKIIKEHTNKNIKLLILGEGSLKTHLVNLIKKLDLESNVKLLGTRKNPYPYLRFSDCFVSSSNHEGQPMTLFEALILEKDIIATDIVGNRSVLLGRGGKLVPNSIEGLFTGLNEYIIKNEKQENPFNADEYNTQALNRFYELIK